jgi:hypothetical protein
MPITPDEVSDRKKEIFPKEVFDVFDNLIAENWDGKTSEFTRKLAKERIVEKLPNVTFDSNWLNIEDI